MHAALVILAVSLSSAPVTRVREPSWPQAIEPSGPRRPAAAALAPARERPDPEDRSMVDPPPDRPRVVLPPEPGWPSASAEPAPARPRAPVRRRAPLRR
jgi:hypothetical protein